MSPNGYPALVKFRGPNIPLTISLKKDEIKRMMARVAKCDAHIAASKEPVIGESNEERKTRLLALVATRLEEIKILEGS